MAGKIRVLQIIKTLNISGAEHFAVELASCINPEKYEVQVCAFFQDGSQIEKHWFQELGRKGITTWYATRWQGLDHLASYMNGIKEMEHQLRSWPADILNSHFQLGTLAALFCRNRGLAQRVVRTAQNHSRKEWSPGLYGWLRYLLISGWVYPISCDIEVGVSRAIVRELLQHPGARFSRRPPQLVTNAIPADLFERAQTYPQSQRKQGQFVVGTIGRLMPQKGYHYLLQAVPQILSVLPDVEFRLIGDGELRTELEKLVRRLGVADRVHFLGRQSDVLAELRQMDLFVLPSLWEGFPLVIMESMAAGIPVVATDINGNRDLVQPGFNGWLVPPANPTILAEQITTALLHPDQRERVSANAFTSLKDFHIDRITAQYEQIYRDILNPKNTKKARRNEIRIS